MKKILFILILSIFSNACGKQTDSEKMSDLGAQDEEIPQTVQTQPPPINYAEQTANNSEEISKELAEIDAQLAEEIKKKKLAYEVKMRFKVENVQKTSQILWQKTLAYEGYISSVNQKNELLRITEHAYSMDSFTRTSTYAPKNNIILQIPLQKLDSFLLEISTLYLLLDEQEVKVYDLTFDYITETLESKLHHLSSVKIEKNIDEKGQKLDEIREAETYVTQQKEEKIRKLVEKMKTIDKVYYAVIDLNFYQEPVNLEEQISLKVQGTEISLGQKIQDAFYKGWLNILDLVVLMFRVWWLWLLLVILFLGYRKYKSKFLKNS